MVQNCHFQPPSVAAKHHCDCCNDRQCDIQTYVPQQQPDNKLQFLISFKKRENTENNFLESINLALCDNMDHQISAALRSLRRESVCCNMNYSEWPVLGQ